MFTNPKVTLTFADGRCAGEVIEVAENIQYVEIPLVETIKDDTFDFIAAPWSYTPKVIRYRREGHQLYLEAD